LHGELTADENMSAAGDGRDVSGDGLGGFREIKAEFG